MRTVPVLSSREQICLSCREKTCCSYYTITVTAQDFVRIARAMQLAPADFLMCRPVFEGEQGGFLLHPDGPSYVLSLARRAVAGETASPCVFLVRTNDQHALCALGHLRPAQCLTFPSYLSDGIVGVAHNPSGCVRTWSYGDVDLDVERQQLMQAAAEESFDHSLIEEWNVLVRSDGRERSFDEFCTYLINNVQEREDVP